MRSIMRHLVCGLMLVLFAVQGANGDSYWDGGGLDDRWLTQENWEGDVLPADGDRVFFDVAGDILVEAGDSVNPRKIIGPSETVLDTVTMTFTGGSLVNTSYWLMGRIAGGVGILNVQGATADLYTRDLKMGYNGGTAIVNISAGELEVYGDIADTGLYVAGDSTSSGTINLTGGTLRVTQLSAIGSGGLIDITEGQMILNGDQVALINGYAGNEITAYGGTGVLQISTFVEEEATYTLVTAIPEPATVCLLGLGMLALTRKKK